MLVGLCGILFDPYKVLILAKTKRVYAIFVREVHTGKFHHDLNVCRYEQTQPRNPRFSFLGWSMMLLVRSTPSLGSTTVVGVTPKEENTEIGILNSYHCAPPSS